MMTNKTNGIIGLILGVLIFIVSLKAGQIEPNHPMIPLGRILSIFSIITGLILVRSKE